MNIRAYCMVENRNVFQLHLWSYPSFPQINYALDSCINIYVSFIAFVYNSIPIIHSSLSFNLFPLHLKMPTYAFRIHFDHSLSLSLSLIFFDRKRSSIFLLTTFSPSAFLPHLTSFLLLLLIRWLPPFQDFSRAGVVQVFSIFLPFLVVTPICLKRLT